MTTDNQKDARHDIYGSDFEPSQEEQEARDRDYLQESTPDYRGLGSID